MIENETRRDIAEYRSRLIDRRRHRAAFIYDKSRKDIHVPDKYTG